MVGFLLCAGAGAHGAPQVVETVGSAAEESILPQALTASSPTVLYFPDYVDGGEVWSVQLVAGNLDPDRSAPVEVRVHDQQGQRVSRFFNTGTRFELPAQGSRVLRRPGRERFAGAGSKSGASRDRSGGC